MTDISTASANSKVVVHGQSDDDENEVLAWALAGAHGFVAQSARDTEITSVVECIARGEVTATAFNAIGPPLLVNLGAASVFPSTSNYLRKEPLPV